MEPTTGGRSLCGPLPTVSARGVFLREAQGWPEHGFQRREHAHSPPAQETGAPPLRLVTAQFHPPGPRTVLCLLIREVVGTRG